MPLLLPVNCPIKTDRMDDLIYFLFLIAWLAFSFYQQSAKKKKRQEQMKAAQERERERQKQEQQESGGTIHQSEVREATPVRAEAEKPKQKPDQDFRKTLEEILLGEEFKDDELEQPLQRYEQKAKPEPKKSAGTSKKNVYQKYYDEEMLEGSQEDLEDHYEPEKIEDQIEKLEEEMVLQEEETIEEPVDKLDFDLRKAIIYSEIINRRYN